MTTVEAQAFIKQLVAEIDSQDNRITAKPYYVTIQETKTQYISAWNRTEGVLVDGEFKNLEECRACLKEYCYKDSDLADVEDVWAAMETEEEATQVERLEYQTYHGHFYTLKAAEEHLKRQGHKYENPQTYIEWAGNNTEAKQMLEALRAIAAS